MGIMMRIVCFAFFLRFCSYCRVTLGKMSTSVAPVYHQIRALYNEEVITVYQAFSDDIAIPAVAAQTLRVPAFSMNRMTWIKPSFTWMMYRCGFGSKDSKQQHVLAIEITREGFEWALRNACLAHDLKNVKPAPPVRIQWDPERDLLLNKLDYRSIQIGLSGEAVQHYVDKWIVKITDITEHVARIKQAIDASDPSEVMEKVGPMLPVEIPYPTPDDIVASMF